MAGGALHLVFTDPRGFVCAEQTVLLGKPLEPDRTSEPAPGAALAFAKTGGRIRVHGRDVEGLVDVKTGQFVSLTVRGRPVLNGGPALMILPLQSEACEPVDLGIWEPLNNVWTDWQADTVEAKTVEDGAVEIGVKGSCREAVGDYVLRLEPSGAVQLDYDFKSRIQVNPRQWGMVFFAPASFDELRWKRRAQWAVYPTDHIGRPQGTATARRAAGLEPYATVRPVRAWSQDATRLGGNDFSSTKYSVLEATLASTTAAIRLESDGHQSVRAFLDEQRTGLLVAGFHTGGGDGFFAVHFAGERRPLGAGDRMQDRIRLQLSGAPPGAALPFRQGGVGRPAAPASAASQSAESGFKPMFQRDAL